MDWPFLLNWLPAHYRHQVPVYSLWFQHSVTSTVVLPSFIVLERQRYGWAEAGIGLSVSHPEVRCSVYIPTMDRSVGNGRELEDHCALGKNYIYCPTIPLLAGYSSDSVCRDALHNAIRGPDEKLQGLNTLVYVILNFFSESTELSTATYDYGCACMVTYAPNDWLPLFQQFAQYKEQCIVPK